MANKRLDEGTRNMRKAAMHLSKARKAGDKERMHTEMAHQCLLGKKSGKKMK